MPGEEALAGGGAAGAAGGVNPYVAGAQVAGSVASGLAKYLQYLDEQQQQQFENKLFVNQDQRAAQLLRDQEAITKNSMTQGDLNQVSTANSIQSQGFDLADKLRRLRGGV